MENSFFFLLFLFGSSLLTACNSALQRLGRSFVYGLFEEHKILSFLKRTYLRFFFKERVWEGLLFCVNFTRQVFQLCYAISFFFFLLFQEPFSHAFETSRWNLLWVLLMTGVIIAVSLVTNFLMELLALLNPRKFLGLTAPITGFLVLLLSPITGPIFKIFSFLFPKKALPKTPPPGLDLRDKILQVLSDSDLALYFDQGDKKLLSSVVSFKERIAREIMVPRIDLFSLPSDTTLQEATESFLTQGYSRIPVYRESVDNIIGVLLFKDLLKQYVRTLAGPEREQKLTSSIEKFLKPVLYTPETKKISQLLQEFRSRQTHLAIVVDEWGGTEGIITIEDILEELVGEIADEYDIDEEIMFSTLPGGGWIVDGKMNIIDIEEELGIKIPQSPEYDTLGGYIVHRAGAIPSKGWRIHHDEFDLEVLSSDERAVDKIRIRPHVEED